MTLSEHWHQLHRWPRRWRCLLKLAVFTLTTALVLFPRVWLIPTWIARLRDLNAVVDPNCPALAPLQAEVVAQTSPGAPLQDLVQPLESAVYARVPYAFDWDTWGVMDYVPTVAEVFAKGQEDCDGRAVVAASLLRRLGYDARLVTDLKHTWVVARDTTAAVPTEVELMSPGEGEKTLAGGENGTRVRWGFAVFENLAHGLAYGIAVFPLGRELLILATLGAVTLQPRSSRARRLVGCALLVAALVLLRTSGPAPGSLAARPAFVWIGYSTVLIGWLVLVIRSPGAPRNFAGRAPLAVAGAKETHNGR